MLKEKDFYTTSELAVILGISKQSVLKRIHNSKDIDLNKLKSIIKHLELI